MFMHGEIKNIVFDVGDVLVAFLYRRLMKNLEFDDETIDFLAENMVLTDVWHLLDLGAVTQAEAIEIFTGRYPQYTDEINMFWSEIEWIVEEFPYSKDLVCNLKKLGYKVFILSNYPVEAAEIHWPKFSFMPYVDGYIISGYEKITKPDPAIYRLLESRYDIDLSECLFIDDRQVNVDGALKVGMKGLLFVDYEQLISDLKSMGVVG